MAPEATWLLDTNTATGGWPRPWVSMRSLAATWAMEINTNPSYGRVRDLDMSLGSSLGLDVTMALDGTAGHPDHPLPLLLQFWLFPQHMNCSASLPLPFAQCNGACPPDTSRVSLPSPGLEAPRRPQSYQYLNASARPHSVASGCWALRTPVGNCSKIFFTALIV